MRLHRFYVLGELKSGDDFALEDKLQIHQITKVFRLEIGDKIIVFNGEGGEFVGEIFEIGKEKIVLKIGEERETLKISKEIHVYLACIRKERFEWAVEKLTELGVASITPIETERSEHINLNIERLRKIAVEASEQCGRGNVPDISSVKSLDLAVNDINHGEILVADFDSPSLSSCNLSSVTYNLFIGPEGGWTDSEREFFRSKNAKFISLGNLVLRAETASVAIATLVSQGI